MLRAILTILVLAYIKKADCQENTESIVEATTGSTATIFNDLLGAEFVGEGVTGLSGSIPDDVGNVNTERAVQIKEFIQATRDRYNFNTSTTTTLLAKNDDYVEALSDVTYTPQVEKDIPETDNNETTMNGGVYSDYWDAITTTNPPAINILTTEGILPLRKDENNFDELNFDYVYNDESSREENDRKPKKDFTVNAPVTEEFLLLSTEAIDTETKQKSYNLFSEISYEDLKPSTNIEEEYDASNTTLSHTEEFPPFPPNTIDLNDLKITTQDLDSRTVEYEEQTVLPNIESTAKENRDEEVLQADNIFGVDKDLDSTTIKFDSDVEESIITIPNVLMTQMTTETNLLAQLDNSSDFSTKSENDTKVKIEEGEDNDEETILSTEENDLGDRNLEFIPGLGIIDLSKETFGSITTTTTTTRTTILSHESDESQDLDTPEYSDIDADLSENNRGQKFNTAEEFLEATTERIFEEMKTDFPENNLDKKSKTYKEDLGTEEFIEVTTRKVLEENFEIGLPFQDVAEFPQGYSSTENASFSDDGIGLRKKDIDLAIGEITTSEGEEYDQNNLSNQFNEDRTEDGLYINLTEEIPEETSNLGTEHVSDFSEYFERTTQEAPLMEDVPLETTTNIIDVWLAQEHLTQKGLENDQEVFTTIEYDVEEKSGEEVRDTTIKSTNIQFIDDIVNEDQTHTDADVLITTPTTVLDIKVAETDTIYKDISTTSPSVDKLESFESKIYDDEDILVSEPAVLSMENTEVNNAFQETTISLLSTSNPILPEDQTNENKNILVTEQTTLGEEDIETDNIYEEIGTTDSIKIIKDKTYQEADILITRPTITLDIEDKKTSTSEETTTTTLPTNISESPEEIFVEKATTFLEEPTTSLPSINTSEISEDSLKEITVTVESTARESTTVISEEFYRISGNTGTTDISEVIEAVSEKLMTTEDDALETSTPFVVISKTTENILANISENNEETSSFEDADENMTGVDVIKGDETTTSNIDQRQEFLTTTGRTNLQTFTIDTSTNSDVNEADVNSTIFSKELVDNGQFTADAINILKDGDYETTEDLNLREEHIDLPKTTEQSIITMIGEDLEGLNVNNEDADKKVNDSTIGFKYDEAYTIISATQIDEEDLIKDKEIGDLYTESTTKEINLEDAITEVYNNILTPIFQTTSVPVSIPDNSETYTKIDTTEVVEDLPGDKVFEKSHIESTTEEEITENFEEIMKIIKSNTDTTTYDYQTTNIPVSTFVNEETYTKSNVIQFSEDSAIDTVIGNLYVESTTKEEFQQTLETTTKATKSYDSFLTPISHVESSEEKNFEDIDDQNIFVENSTSSTEISTIAVAVGLTALNENVTEYREETTTNINDEKEEELITEANRTEEEESEESEKEDTDQDIKDDESNEEESNIPENEDQLILENDEKRDEDGEGKNERDEGTVTDILLEKTEDSIENNEEKYTEEDLYQKDDVITTDSVISSMKELDELDSKVPLRTSPESKVQEDLTTSTNSLEVKGNKEVVTYNNKMNISLHEVDEQFSKHVFKTYIDRNTTEQVPVKQQTLPTPINTKDLLKEIVSNVEHVLTDRDANINLLSNQTKNWQKISLNELVEEEEKEDRDKDSKEEEDGASTVKLLENELDSGIDDTSYIDIISPNYYDEDYTSSEIFNRTETIYSDNQNNYMPSISINSKEDYCLEGNISIRIFIGEHIIKAPEDSLVFVNCSQQVYHLVISWRTEDQERFNNTVVINVRMDEQDYFIESVNLIHIDNVEATESMKYGLELLRTKVEEDMTGNVLVDFENGYQLELLDVYLKFKNFVRHLESETASQSKPVINKMMLIVISASVASCLILLVVGAILYKKFSTKATIYKMTIE